MPIVEEDILFDIEQSLEIVPKGRRMDRVHLLSHPQTASFWQRALSFYAKCDSLGMPPSERVERMINCLPVF